MTKKEQEIFNELVERNKKLKKAVQNVNRKKKKIQAEIEQLGKDIDALEKRYVNRQRRNSKSNQFN